jgi:hypothetical protein
LTITLCFPYVAYIALFLGVIFTPAVEALVFNDEKATIREFTGKIRVEAIRGGLQPEGRLRTTFEIAYPALYAWMVIQ